jgi:hypothetical protein
MKKFLNCPIGIEFSPNKRRQVTKDKLINSHKKGIEPIPKDNTIESMTGSVKIAEKENRIETSEKTENLITFGRVLRIVRPSGLFLEPGKKKNSYKNGKINRDMFYNFRRASDTKTHIQKYPSAKDKGNKINGREEERCFSICRYGGIRHSEPAISY